MKESISKVRAVGGSLMVRIPKDLAKAESLRPGELVSISVKKARRDFFGSLRSVQKFSKADELKSHD